MLHPKTLLVAVLSERTVLTTSELLGEEEWLPNNITLSTAIEPFLKKIRMILCFYGKNQNVNKTITLECEISKFHTFIQRPLSNLCFRKSLQPKVESKLNPVKKRFPLQKLWVKIAKTNTSILQL